MKKKEKQDFSDHTQKKIVKKIASVAAAVAGKIDTIALREKMEDAGPLT